MGEPKNAAERDTTIQRGMTMPQIIEMGGGSKVDGALPEFPAGSSRVISPTALQGVRGNVVAAKSGLPLAGVEIQWITSEHFPRHRNGTDVVIGTAISEADGRFSIVSSVSPEAETILCQLKHETGQSTQLQIPSLAKNGSAQRFAISTTSLETIIRISGPAPKKAQWAAFADYQMTNPRL